MWRRQIWIQACLGGALAGALVEVLVIRLNPLAGLSTPATLLGWLVWMSWGAVVVGVPLALLRMLSRVVRSRAPKKVRWRLPEIFAAIYIVAAVLTRVNADKHTVFLSGSAHRTLGQDAVAWLIAGILVFASGAWVLQRRDETPVRRRSRLLRSRWRLAYILLFLALPLVRPMVQPSPPAEAIQAAAEPLGCPSRPLLVVGVEGLDSRVLLAHAAGDRYPSLTALVSSGSWGVVEPYPPFLRQSLWTTTATGTYPRHHGTRSRWIWRLPGALPNPIDLVPWTPLGSRWMLPWALARKHDPPPPSVPPLWQRLRASRVDTRVLGWPGPWSEAAVADSAIGAGTGGAGDLVLSPAELMDPAFRDALITALEPFPEKRADVIAAMDSDLAAVRASVEACATGARNLWVHLVGLASVRTDFEPLSPRDVTQRRVLELGLEQLDQLLAELLEAVGPEALVAVVSPYGMEPPDPFERLLRLGGAGGSWRASAQSTPDGTLILLGDGIVAGRRDSRSRLTDLAPTLCYLLGLPVAQYMEGRVVLDAVEPAYVAGQPLRVVG